MSRLGGRRSLVLDDVVPSGAARRKSSQSGRVGDGESPIRRKPSIAVSTGSRGRGASLAQIGTGFSVESRLEDDASPAQSSGDDREGGLSRHASHTRTLSHRSVLSNSGTSSKVHLTTPGVHSPSEHDVDPFAHFADNPYRFRSQEDRFRSHEDRNAAAAKFHGEGERLSRRLTSIQHNVEAILNAYDGSGSDSARGREPEGLTPTAPHENAESAGYTYQVEMLLEEREKMKREIADLRMQLSRAGAGGRRRSVADQARRETFSKIFPGPQAQATTRGTQTSPPDGTHGVPLLDGGGSDASPTEGGPVSLLQSLHSSLPPDGFELQPAPSYQENVQRLIKAKEVTAPPPPNSAPLHGTYAVVRVDVENSVLSNLLYYLPGEVMPAVVEVWMAVRRLYESLGGVELRGTNSLQQTVLFRAANPGGVVEFCNAVHTACLDINWPAKVLEDPDARLRYVDTGGAVLWKGVPVTVAVLTSRVTVDFVAIDDGHRTYHIADRPVLERLSRTARPGETVMTSSFHRAAVGEADPNTSTFTVLVDGGGPKKEGVVQLLPKVLRTRRFADVHVEFWTSAGGEQSGREAVSRSNSPGSGVGAAVVPAAPLAEPRGRVAFVCLDIPHSERLWHEEYSGMQLAIKNYNALVRRQAEAQRGYLMRAADDGFFYAFPHENAAMVFAVELQTQLHQSQWPDTLLKHELCCAETDNKGRAVFAGLRVRMAVHSGRTLSLPHPETGVVDYWGPPVAVTAKLCGAGHGGQVLVTDACFSKTSNQVSIACTTMAPIRLPGMKCALKVLEVYPSKLARRKQHHPGDGFPEKSKWETSVYADPAKIQTAETMLQQAAVLHGGDDGSPGGDELDAAAFRSDAARANHEDANTVVMPPTQKVTLVLVEVMGIAALFERDYDATTDALSVYTATLRRAVAGHSGYVVTHDQDAFMVAFEEEEVAVLFAMAVQNNLANAKWPPAILNYTKSETNKTGQVLHRGLPACVAVVTGRPLCLPSPVSGEMDYWGMVVKHGLVLGAVAEGGEILVCGETYEAGVRHHKSLNQGTKGPKILEYRDVPLPELRDPQTVVRIVPFELRERQYSKLPTTAQRTRIRPSKWPREPRGERKRLDSAAQIMKCLANMYCNTIPLAITEGLDVDGPPVGLVALVFTDIQSSTKLWEKSSDVMLASIQLHNDVMRQCIAKFGGYEVKTEGDAFMVSFSSIKNAVFFCCDAQRELVNAPWPAGLLDNFDPLTDIKPARQGEGVGGNLWRGLRMRMGIHTGCPTCLPDPVSGRMDYWGPMVNKSARISSVATGGQVVMSAGVYEQCKADLEREKAHVKDLGSFELKGINGKTQIYEVLPKELRARDFSDGKKKDDAAKGKGAKEDKKKKRDEKKAVAASKAKEDKNPADTKGLGELLSPSRSASPEAPSLSRQSSIASILEDFAWARSAYTDTDKMTHAAAINKLILSGGLMDTTTAGQGADPKRAAVLALTADVDPQTVKNSAFIEDLRKQMEEDTLAVSEVIGARPLETVVESVVRATPSTAPFEVAPFTPSTGRRRASATTCTPLPAPVVPRRRSNPIVDFVPAIPFSSSAQASPVTEPEEEPTPPQRGVSVRPPRSPRDRPEQPSPAARTKGDAQLFASLHRLGSMHRRRKKLFGKWHSAMDKVVKGLKRQASSELDPSAPASASSVSLLPSPLHPLPDADHIFGKEFMDLLERAECDRMHHEDVDACSPRRQRGAHLLPRSSGKAGCTGSPQGIATPPPARAKLDLFRDYIEVETGGDAKNERLGFTLLHHQIARLNTKVAELAEKRAATYGPMTEEDAREFAYQCLVCINPRHAKLLKSPSASNLEDILAATRRDVINGSEARVGVTKCRQSIIGMVLGWAMALAGKEGAVVVPDTEISDSTPMTRPARALSAGSPRAAPKRGGSLRSRMKSELSATTTNPPAPKQQQGKPHQDRFKGAVLAVSATLRLEDDTGRRRTAPVDASLPGQLGQPRSLEPHVPTPGTRESPRRYQGRPPQVFETDVQEIGHPRAGGKEPPGYSRSLSPERRGTGRHITSAGGRTKQILGSLSLR
eukprot:TRINITY_DN2133_c0_g2_i2.p1 TRINITY_DN2133_c0_g2~~TRINITY_DN2133_c0_g2_i2.p1  ORF type:complete len:2057 (+),score=546.29 TRINITY_DN2133_c0_g2_i2:112-6282(+)